MKNVDYTAAVEISKDIAARVEVLRDEFTARIIEAYGEDARFFFSCPTSIDNYVVQCYPDEVTDGAVLNFSDDNSDFYNYDFNGEIIVECVRKKDDR